MNARRALFPAASIVHRWNARPRLSNCLKRLARLRPISILHSAKRRLVALPTATFSRRWGFRCLMVSASLATALTLSTNTSKQTISHVAALSSAASFYQSNAHRNLERKLNPRTHAERPSLARRREARRALHAGNKMHRRQVSNAPVSGTWLPVPAIWAAGVQRRGDSHARSVRYESSWIPGRR